MDSEQRNPETEKNPAQNELDLGFNQMEPITPKKVIKPEPSLFDKAKSLFNKKEPKDVENQFAARKEPVFGATGANGEASMTTENQTEPTSPETLTETVATAESATTEPTDFTETQPETAETVEKPKAGLKNPENWAILSVLPQKHRRIFVVLAGVVLLLIFILWMKPSSDTVQSFEQQSNNDVPIQFQQLDQSQTNEPTILDNAAQQPAQPDNTAANLVETAGVNSADNLNAVQAGEQSAAATENTANTAQPSEAAKPTETKPLENTAVTATAKPQESVKPRPVAQETAKKPEPVRTEKTKPAEKTVAKTQPTKTPAAKTEKQVIDILEARPATTKAAAGSKTLTIPQGVTLMQVFRDNKLPVADVNAMTKANGAGNALSSFKPGDKVQVSMNGQGRVSELRLSNGARFVRQSDGSYQFRK